MTRFADFKAHYFEAGPACLLAYLLDFVGGTALGFLFGLAVFFRVLEHLA